MRHTGDTGIVKHEYHEGPKAGENFEQLVKAVFRAPKVEAPKKQPKTKTKTTHKKAIGKDKA